ncbi:MAG: TetR/AcrR family transcriptional regulator [Dysgonomonas sp.]
MINNSKKKILEKAFNLFLTRSYDSVSMREIQEAAKVSRGAIYHHFSSKEEIYEDIINEYLLPMFSSYSLITDEEKKTLQSAILASLKNRQNYLNSLKETVSTKMADYYLFQFMFQATEHSKNFKEQINLQTEKEFNGWRSLVQFAMRSGEIKSDIDIDYVAQSFLTIPFGLGVFSAFSNYVNINTNDLRSSYLKFYNLLKKNSFG